MLLQNVSEARQFPLMNFILSEKLSIALGGEMMDVASSGADDSVSRHRDTLAEIEFIAVVRQTLIETAQLPPEVQPDEKRETSGPRQIDSG